jgi:MSHA pilin protein MshA
MHYRNKGFTLIELVVVIIVLAVLAAVAIPKFVSMSKDSKKSTLESVAGAMRSGLILVHSKAVIEGKDKGRQTIDIDGVAVPLYDGYPVATLGSNEMMNKQLQAWLVIDSEPSHDTQGSSATFFVGKYSSRGMITIFFAEDYSRRGFSLACQLTYTYSATKDLDILVRTEDC